VDGTDDSPSVINADDGRLNAMAQLIANLASILGKLDSNHAFGASTDKLKTTMLVR
jgi:hypothetical protein